MDEFILGVGAKVHVVSRRAFPEDVRRHFAGVVQSCSGGVVRVEGYAFVLKGSTNEYERRTEKRVRVISLTDARNTINVLPETVRIDRLTYTFSSGRLLMIDGDGYELELTEFVPGA
jgi:hypothetical protein